MKNVLCFGDSNTWGANPIAGWGQGRRLSQSERWTGVMKSRLGPDWEVITEGQPARTTVLEDVVGGGQLSGLTYLKPCLLSHMPLDYVILMLGTNDFKRRFNLVAEDVAVGVDRLLKEIKFSDTLIGGLANVLVICPPPLKVTGIFATMFEGGDVNSRDLAPYLQEIALAHGAMYLDAGEYIESSDVDGIHIDSEQHQKLGKVVASVMLEAARVDEAATS